MVYTVQLSTLLFLLKLKSMAKGHKSDIKIMLQSNTNCLQNSSFKKIFQ